MPRPLTPLEEREREIETMQLRDMMATPGWRVLCQMWVEKRSSIERAGKNCRKNKTALSHWARVDGFDQACEAAIEAVSNFQRDQEQAEAVSPLAPAMPG